MTDKTEHDPIVGDTPAHLSPDANAIALWCGAARIADAIVGEFDERLRP